MGQGLLPAGIGIVVGLGMSLAIGRLIESLLFGVEPADPAVFGAVAALALFLSVTAIFFPAHRAARLDPSMSLKME